MKLVLSLALVVASIWQSVEGRAADLDFINRPHCKFRLTGEILEGDDNRVRSVLKRAGFPKDDPDGDYACLHSNGGSWQGGINLARLFLEMGIGTYVDQDEACLSACAIAFMGGRHYDPDGKFTARLLHPKGRLGFHSPSLVLPKGTYDDATVTRSYDVALRAISDLMKFSLEVPIETYASDEKIRIPMSLVKDLLQVGAADFLYIDTVDKAGRWGFSIDKVRLEVDASPELAANACINAFAWQKDKTHTETKQTFEQRGNFDGNSNGVSVKAGARAVTPIHFEWSYSVGLAEAYRTNLCEVKISTPRSSDANVKMSLELFVAHSNGATDETEKVKVNIPMMPSWALLPGDTPLASLQLFRSQNRGLQHLRPSGGAPTGSGSWNHNGSVMRLIADGTKRMFVYQQPREGMREQGVTSETPLFTGTRNGNTYAGTARVFRRGCGAQQYQVSGTVSDDQKTVSMSGRAPRVNDRCEVFGYRDDTLVFEYIE